MDFRTLLFRFPFQSAVGGAVVIHSGFKASKVAVTVFDDYEGIVDKSAVEGDKW